MDDLTMLEAVLSHIHNWFPVKNGRHAGTFTIVSGAPQVGFLAQGQLYRIRGSVFSDGLHRYGDEAPLREETFDGEVWALAVPPAVVSLANEIAEYNAKNPASDKTSESFGGYSYTRGGASSTGGASAGGWQFAYASRLRPYMRPYDD